MSMRRSRAFRVPALAIFILLLSVSLPAQLRVRPVGELPGDASLKLALRQLKTVGSFMETTAHPDDEDNALLAMMSHGRGMRTALVTATRGDGGQNEIGPEIFQALGVLRTEELLAVHRFDGAEQYFTRAIDFGFSFSIDESIEKWGHDEILGDFVRHIRAIRPDVIAGFLCGGAGGGQHHQASARLTIEAFRAAADPARYPDQIRDGLRPWQAKRVFCTEGFCRAGPDCAGADPRPAARELVGVRSGARPHVQRARHRRRAACTSARARRSCCRCRARQSRASIACGTAPSASRGSRRSDMFEGIDTSLPGLAAFAGEQPPAALTAALRPSRASVADGVAGTRCARGPRPRRRPSSSGLAAVRALRAKLAVAWGCPTPRATRSTSGWRQRRRSSRQALVLDLRHARRGARGRRRGGAGQPMKLSLVARRTTDPATSRVKSVAVRRLRRRSSPACDGRRSEWPARCTCAAELQRRRTAPVSTPYWTPRKDAARYDFEPDVPFGVPFRPSPFRATCALSIGGADVSVERTVEYRYSDLFAGEKRMELQVVPAVRRPRLARHRCVPTPARRGERHRRGRAPAVHVRTVEVTVSNNKGAGRRHGVAARAATAGAPLPPSAPVKFAREDEDTTVQFSVTPAGRGQAGRLRRRRARSPAGHERVLDTGYEVVEYPHIHRRHVVEPARRASR